MKRLLPLLLLILLLAGCGQGPGAATSSKPSNPPSSASASVPDSSGPEDPTPPSGDLTPPDTQWQGAYLGVLEGLCEEYGKYAIPADTDIISGVKYAQLLDFDGDGMRELVVLFDHTVRLYTCREGEPVLLYEGAVGARFGQTDVSYTIQINAMADTPCLVLFHSEYEWTQEAISLIRLSGGEAVVTELLAEVEAQNDLPDREALTSFFINGQPVDREVYEAARSAALDDSLEIDADWMEFPASQEQLDLLLHRLESWSLGRGYYVLPDSDAAYLTEEALTRLTARELRLARNEIYARHGRTFTAPDLKAYFTEQDWYQPLYTPEEFDPMGTELLNKYEVANLSLILAVERSGNFDQNAPSLAPEEALAIAEAYWDYRDGMLDSATGFLLAISADEQVEAGGRSYYPFRLRLLVDDDHWSTVDLVYVDAQSGAVTSAPSE